MREPDCLKLRDLVALPEIAARIPQPEAIRTRLDVTASLSRSFFRRESRTENVLSEGGRA